MAVCGAALLPAVAAILDEVRGVALLRCLRAEAVVKRWLTGWSQ